MTGAFMRATWLTTVLMFQNQEGEEEEEIIQMEGVDTMVIMAPS